MFALRDACAALALRSLSFSPTADLVSAMRSRIASAIVSTSVVAGNSAMSRGEERFFSQTSAF